MRHLRLHAVPGSPPLTPLVLQRTSTGELLQQTPAEVSATHPVLHLFSSPLFLETDTESLWHILYHRRIHSLWTEGLTSNAGSKPSKGRISKASFVPGGARSAFSEGSKTQSLSK